MPLQEDRQKAERRTELKTILSAVKDHGPGWTRRDVIIASIPREERPERPGNAFGFLKRRGYVEARQHQHDARKREYKPTGKELAPITAEAAAAD